MMVSQQHETSVVGEAVDCERRGGNTDAAEGLDGVDVEVGNLEGRHFAGSPLGSCSKVTRRMESRRFE